MKKIIKYSTISITGFLFLLTVTAILLPAFINEQKYVPLIEQKILDLTGRSLTIGNDLNISYFPWLSISFSDLKLGNPEGFSTDDFLTIKSFETQVELLSLLFGQIHVRRFVVGGLEVNMEKRSDGSRNWFFSKNGDQPVPLQTQSDSSRGVLPENMSIDLFVVTDAKIDLKDQVRQTEYHINDVMLLATEVALDKPFTAEIKALIGGKPVAIEGSIGPFGKNTGIESVAVDVRLVLANVMKASIRGKFSNLYSSRSYDLNMQVEPFSPRYLCDILDIGFPISISSPGTFDSLSLNMIVKGDRSEIRVERGDARLDNTGIDFSFTAKNFDRPVVILDVELDSIDLNHYFSSDFAEGTENSNEDSVYKSKIYNCSIWRELYITGNLALKTVTFSGRTIHDVRAHFNGSNGIFTIDPSSFSLNNGQVQSTAKINVQKDIPEISVSVQSKNLHFGELLHGSGNNESIAGTLNGEMDADCKGFDSDLIKKTLNGQGNFVLQNGVLHGIDLQGNAAETSFIEYSEISSAFTVKDGLVTLQDTKLLAPSVKILVTGSGDLVTDEINLKMMPSNVNVGKGLEISKDDSQGFMPVAVTGTFSSPVFVVDKQNPTVKIAQPANKVNAQKLVDEKIPSPIDEDVKGLVGKALIDPEIVARRFGLQPVEIKSRKSKKIFPVGNGKIEIGQLLEEDVFRDLSGGLN